MICPIRHPFPIFPDLPWICSINEALEKRHSAAARLETAEPGPKKINGFPYFCYGDLGDLWAPLHLDCSIPDYPPINRYKQNTKPLGFILRNLRNSMCTLNFDLNPMICVILWICCFRDPKIHLSRRGLESLQDAHRELKQPPGHVGYVGHRPAMSCF